MSYRKTVTLAQPKAAPPADIQADGTPVPDAECGRFHAPSAPSGDASSSDRS
jgi:hypothetical protein